MKKLFLVLVLVVSSFAFDWSGKVSWAMSYDSAKKMAQREHKLIFVDVALQNCPPCKYLATKVYTNDKVAQYMNKNFVPVLIMANQDTMPIDVNNYFTGSTPTLMFIDPKGKLVYRAVGAVPADKFLKMLKQINEKYKQLKR